MFTVWPLMGGLVFGLGIAVTVRSTRPPALAAAAQRVGVPTASSSVSRAGRPFMRLRPPAAPVQQAKDLAVLERDPIAHAAAKMVWALSLAAAAAGLAAGAVVTGMSTNAAVLLVLVSGGATTGYLIPDRRLRRDARRRRVDAVAALSSYLDLVTVLLAGGAGIETALHAAAESGDGWTYRQLRAALMRARATRISVWSCFADLGRSTGIDEFVELSASVQLAGQQGARIARSLGTRAATLRAHVLAGIEADAHAASERMGLPTVLMFVGFLFLLGYPAAQVILRTP